uniref:NAD-dependent epimerase/dehydratase domain-containing protein n=1 Tax=Dunaliella tertiolecta TaxID=3047 RepID=A0A6S8JW27_DUNTE|mmetsp:Transcript_17148/g.47558  ORF Transcript_17148/g.47558 Transcript_17148/m.47558 type:complete len:393 (+) Transcript_17148:482-1660(+)|eukprot:1142242-Pelagomonas_calceolata.AAC.2
MPNVYCKYLTAMVLALMLGMAVFQDYISKNIRASLPETHRALIRTCIPRNKSKNYVLVTGAAGFIGFHTALELAKRGDVVVGLDNFNDYYPVSLKIARASSLLEAGIAVIKADVNDLTIVRRMFDYCRFTHVIHFAAQAGVRYAARNPMSYVQSNIAGTVSLLEAIRQQPELPKLVYASSSSVYGNSMRLPFEENDRADRPASLYAASKRSQEMITQAYSSMYKISATGLRFFTVYGPFGRPDMSVMSFTNKILQGSPIKLFKQPDGSDLARDFTYISDIVRGVLGALDFTPSSGDHSFRHTVFNLGNSKVVDVSSMLSILQGLLHKNATVEKYSLPSVGEVLVTNADISSAHAAFEYEPQVDIQSGLRLFLSWYLSIDSKLRHDLSQYIPD